MLSISKLQDICSSKGVILMPDLFFASLLNIVLLTMTGNKYKNLKLREIVRDLTLFQRATDVTGSAISMSPWLRHVAPNFFGFTSSKIANASMLAFLKVSIIFIQFVV